jgi:hypothetical protein
MRGVLKVIAIETAIESPLTSRDTGASLSLG